MKVRINGRSMDADTVQVSREDGEITLFEDGGKLFCKSDSPVAPARFAPNTVCLDFASTPEEVNLYRGIIESRMNIVPETVADWQEPGDGDRCCGSCVYFAFEDTEGTGICRRKHNQLTKCWKICDKYRQRKQK